MNLDLQINLNSMSINIIFVFNNFKCMENKELSTIQEIYQEMQQNEKWLSIYFTFEELLLESDSVEYLELHYNYLKDRQKEALYYYIRNAFGKRQSKDIVSSFLKSKFEQEEDTITQGDVIQILGNIKSKYAELLALDNIHSNNQDIRYRCIIVLGWVGKSQTLSILDERMLNDDIGQLRGYAATAMRQIWYNHPKTKEKITELIKNAISNEIDNEALIGMIITIQDMYRKKFGLKESVYGDISGNVQEAKDKTLKFINKL